MPLKSISAAALMSFAALAPASAQGESSAVCLGINANGLRAGAQLEDVCRSYPTLCMAFMPVLSEIVELIANGHVTVDTLEHGDFNDVIEHFGPALGSAIAFAIVCAANEPHCTWFSEELEQPIMSLLYNAALFVANNCD